MENMLRGSLTSTTDAKGVLGFKGERGYSAYEIAVLHGYEGTEQDWIDHFGLDLSNYVQTSDVVDNLTSTETTHPLSAKQGKVLKDDIGDLTGLETENKDNTVDAINELKGNIDALDERGIYSSTEKVIGTWIDGKPIYRKVYSISGSMVQNTWTTVTSLSNVATLVKGLMGGSSNNCVWNDVSLRVLDNNIQYYSPLTHAYDWTIVEYTKTTD